MLLFLIFGFAIKRWEDLWQKISDVSTRRMSLLSDYSQNQLQREINRKINEHVKFAVRINDLYERTADLVVKGTYIEGAKDMPNGKLEKLSKLKNNEFDITVEEYDDIVGETENCLKEMKIALQKR